jgi:hypothetical protein
MPRKRQRNPKSDEEQGNNYEIFIDFGKHRVSDPAIAQKLQNLIKATYLREAFMILLALSAENHAVAIDRAQVTLTNNI